MERKPNNEADSSLVRPSPSAGPIREIFSRAKTPDSDTWAYLIPAPPQPQCTIHFRPLGIRYSRMPHSSCEGFPTIRSSMNDHESSSLLSFYRLNPIAAAIGQPNLSPL